MQPELAQVAKSEETESSGLVYLFVNIELKIPSLHYGMTKEKHKPIICHLVVKGRNLIMNPLQRNSMIIMRFSEVKYVF